MALTPRSHRATRDVMTRRLADNGRAAGRIILPVSAALLDCELLDVVNISHVAGPTDGADGWGHRPQDRKIAEIIGMKLDPNTWKMELTARDLQRSLLLGTWDSLDGAMSSDVIWDGVARRMPHSGYHHFRGSKSYVEDASDGLIRERSIHEPTLTDEGVYLERESTNLLARSTAISQTTGLTLTGTGVNGSAIGGTTAEIFGTRVIDGTESVITAYCWYFLAGNPHAANLYATWPTTATVSANTICTVSIDHEANAAGDLEWRLTRSVDGWYYNAGSDTWQALSVWNTAAATTTSVRYIEEGIDVGGSNTTLVFEIGLMSGGTASRTHRVHHVQLEEKAWASTRMPYDNGSFTRKLDAYTIDNSTGRREWNETRGACLIRWNPLANTAAAALAAANFLLLRVVHDANNHLVIRYRSGTGTMTVIITAAGVTVTLSYAMTIVRGTEVSVGYRWATVEAGSGGELDDDYGAATSGQRNVDLWIDGVVRDNDETAAMTEASESRIEVGWRSDDNTAADGLIRQRRLLPYVPSNVDMQRWMAA